jgi:hypothetical protein
LRRSILFHAFVILTTAFVLGLVTGFAHGAHHASARAWLIAHVTGIMVALLMAVVGLLWADLRLGRRSARVLYWATVPANYVIFVILGVLAPALGASPALAVPDAVPPPAAVQALVTAGIALATISNFVGSILVVVGMRGGESQRTR